MKVSLVMHKHIVIATVTSTVADILPLLFEKRLNSLPILDKSRTLVGIVVREDILRLLYPDYQEYVREMLNTDELDVFDKDFSDMLQVNIKTIMQKAVITTTPTTSVMQALARMIAHHIDQMPVVNDRGKLVGMVSKSDIFYALYRVNKKRIHG